MFPALRQRHTRWRAAIANRRVLNAEAVAQRGVAFPGRWVVGPAAVCGPLLILTGMLLRIRYHYFFPEQLAGYEQHPVLITAAYACYASGTVLLWPAVLELARRIGATHPRWAHWGGCLVMFGLFTRTFHFGTDHLAFHLVDSQGLTTAVAAVDHYYVAWRDIGWHPFRMLSGTIVTGWVVLAIGAYRSGVLGPGRAVLLGLMSMLALGTLKGTQIPQSLIAAAGLCATFIPLGVAVLRDGPRPSNRALFWLAVLLGLFVLGQFHAPRG
ncbi:hypothetical protein [Pilimelia columellifera]|uniref:Uncharacterized protein n=1 Tax=Pilimelia columellifera subsp. columellifera TaxID=706583 RepID=A0ABN3NRV1_9ACTN